MTFLNEFNVSMLISIHPQANPQHVQKALESICHQTLLPDEVVVVKDGRLPRCLDEEIVLWMRKCEIKTKLIELYENSGLAVALNRGLGECAYTWVARMDADDVMNPGRLERQMTFLVQHPEVDVVGSWIIEYDDHMKHMTGIKTVPLGHEEICKFAKWRNPMNHMTVVFRKQAVMRMGGYYESLRKLQDYALWGKMMVAGYKFANIPETLVMVRTGADFISRRSSLNLLPYHLILGLYLWRNKFFRTHELLFYLATRFSMRVMPAASLEALFRVLRKPA